MIGLALPSSCFLFLVGRLGWLAQPRGIHDSIKRLDSLAPIGTIRSNKQARYGVPRLEEREGGDYQNRGARSS